MEDRKLLFEDKHLKNKPWDRMAINMSPHDTPPNELIIRSSFMFYALVNTFVASPLVALTFALRGLSYIYTILYCVIMAPLLIFLTDKEGYYDQILMVHQCLILAVPIYTHYTNGGLLATRGTFLGSLLCPLGAALYCKTNVAFGWFAIYMVVFIGLFFLEYSMASNEDNANANASAINNGEITALSPLECVFFFMNIGGVLIITFAGAMTFRIKLDSEYKRSERLIDNILPKSIARRLKEGESHIIENFDGVTILFADLVGFTSAAAVNQPAFLIGMFLRDVFSAWDQLLLQRNIDKIKTIGDAFMAVGGIEEHQGRASKEGTSTNNTDGGAIHGGNSNSSSSSDNSDSSQRSAKQVTIEMVLLALEMQQALDCINKRYGVNFKCRIGIHTGPVIAGVIGVKKFSFDVWGDAVNTASRMESHGIPGYLQISSDTYKEVKAAMSSLGIDVRYRGNIEVKGKGRMDTYLIQMSQGNKAATSIDAGDDTAPVTGLRRRPISVVKVPSAGDITSAEK